MMHNITEDTPPDMLAGAMDLCVRLPDGRDVKMAVERSTPMMDLLVQVTTAYKLRPSEYIIQPLDMSEKERVLPYKPNAPIGALDTQQIWVLPKGRMPAPKAPPPPGHQPFESTFRLQVHLPRNQFCVIRVSKHVMLEDIMKKVCEEKNLDPRKYEFRHPANIDKVLDPKRTLNDYEITEITVVHRGTSTHLSQTISSSDIMALQREEDRRKLQTKTGGGVLNLIFRRGRTSMGSGSISSDTRSISPTQSDDSRSVTPPAVQPQILPPVPQEVKQPPSRPKPPQRKRRPAPKPPSQPPASETISPAASVEKCQQEVTAKLDNGLTICHSRNSSDSSGYHEASILSDNCNTSLPRRPKSTVINTNLTNLSVDQNLEMSKSTGNLTNMTTQSKSTMSLSNAGRKKKAPPPPPALKSANSMANISTSVPVVASNYVESPTIHPDNSAPSSLPVISDSLPKPKPRTVRTQFPMPLPRKLITDLPSEELDKSSVINANNNKTVFNSTSEDLDKNSLKIDSELSDTTLHNSSSDSELSTKSTSSKLGRERGFQIGKSMLSIDDQIDNSNQEQSDTISIKTLNSSSSSQNIPEDLERLEINNITMFDSKSKQRNKKCSRTHKTSAYAEIHELEQNELYGKVLPRTFSQPTNTLPNNNIARTMRNVESTPLLSSCGDTNIKKWSNVQKLGRDENSLSISHHWVIGDSDADSTWSTTPVEVTSIPPTSVSSIQTASLSQASSNLQPPSQSSSPTQIISIKEELNHEKKLLVEENASVETKTELISKKESIEEVKKEENKIDSSIQILKSETKENINDLDAEWQYTLPSPPTAFRDSSPTNFTDLTNYDTVTFNGLSSDSVVTSPALFEKLENIRDTRSETETIDSEIEATSIKQEEILTSKYLSLENLEKRKSLVLERELASLKIAQNENNSSTRSSEVDKSMKLQRDNLKNEIEEAIHQKNKSSSLSRTNSQAREKILLSATDSTLPNFKITTYDQPKSKINIFEDDSIRSNVENKSTNSSKRNSFVENIKTVENEDVSFVRKRHSLISSSTENMYLAKRNSIDDFIFKKPQEVSKYKKHPSTTNLNDTINKTNDTVSRSESFSSKNNNNNGVWSRSSPVKRSKSHISLNKYKEDNKNSPLKSEEGLHKSNSLFNVSGLQSLEVMRMILPKLGNTPPNSPAEELKSPKMELPTTPPKMVEKESTPKKYQYRGPPAINLGTWSDRPKSQVAIKEDKDYKISNCAVKNQFNFETNLKPQQNYSSVNIRVNGFETKDQVDSGKLNIKINSDPPKTIAQQATGNVIIKIGNNETNNTGNPNKSENKLRENSFYSRFLNQTTATGYRKPLGNINGVEKPRPHSIAFDASCPDLSRVPIVRAVELKKPYKDKGNKSVTQIIPDNDANKSLSNGETKKHSSVYLSSENLNKIEQNSQSNKTLSLFSKPISRGNSFASARNNSPVVKGFRETETIANQYGTLPVKPQNTLKRTENSFFNRKPKEETNIFENVVLRKTVSNGLPSKRHSSFIPPPPPLQMPKGAAVTKKPVQRQIEAPDPRDLLLDSIRKFGGKTGLRAVK